MWPSSSITFANSIYNGNVWAASYLLYQTDPIFYGHSGDRQEVTWRNYAAHAFDDCWKSSLNILYFCSKYSKNLDFIGNVYDNIKSSSEGGCRLIQKEMWRWQHISILHNLLHTKARSFFLPLISPFSLPSLPLLPSSVYFPPFTPSLHHQNNVC